MINNFRSAYNQNFQETRYQALLEDIEADFGYKVAFKIAETPIFIPKAFKNKLIEASDIILSQIFSEPYLSQMHKAVPKEYHVPNPDAMPSVLALDFAVCKDENGELSPQIIEMQGFPSLFAYQIYLADLYRKHFEIPENLTNFFGNHNTESYLQSLKEVIIGKHATENVVLLEIEPELQKTRIDFSCTEKYLGIESVCLTNVKKQGNRLFYEKNGKMIRIERIYNRVIFDELERRTDLQFDFDFRDELEVEWVAHPSWFFKISKFTLPFMDNPFVPKAYFLDQLHEIPSDLENYVLKPLFSFAGGGVVFDVTRPIIDAVKDPENYILMKKINYEPVIETPDIAAKVEIRLLFGLKNGKMELLTNLIRLSKGKMMGVDFNKGMSWVGGSVAFME